MEKVTATNYELRTPSGQWLGQVVLTSDGMFSSVTDWGNLSFKWGKPSGDFREFILSLSIDYFAVKMYSGLSYIAHGPKFEKACTRFAEKILPALWTALREEMESEK